MTTWTTWLCAAREEWTRVILRTPSVLLILIGLPLIYPLIVSWLYSEDSVVEQPVALVDDDRSAISRRIALGLAAAPEVDIVLKPAAVNEALDALTDRQVEMVVWLPPDLSQRVERGEQAGIRVWVNTANVLVYGVVYPAVVNVVSQINQEIGRNRLVAAGLSNASAEGRVTPLHTDTRVAFHPTLSYGSFLVPGILLLVVQQLLIIGLALSAGFERETAGPNHGSRQSPWAWLWGKAAGQSLLWVLGMLFIHMVVVPFFGWPAQGTASILLLLALFMLATLPMAVLIARLIPDRHAAFQVLMYLTVPLLMASGFAWPRDQMPLWTRVVSAVFPATPALQGLRALSMRTGDLSDIGPQMAWLAWQAMGWSLAVGLAAACEAGASRIFPSARHPAKVRSSNGTECPTDLPG